jgi:hypothetical protein
MIGRGDTAPHRAKSVLLVLCMTSGLALHASAASAEPGDDCVASAEQSQPLQHDGKLTAARRKLMACSRPECPAVVRNDCTKWLSELDAMMPTLVVRAVDSAGADVVGVRVFIDGERRDVAGSEGKELEVDPGTHALRVEHEGDAPVEQTIVVRESERHRLVSVTFGHAVPTPAAVPSATATPPEAPASGSGRSIVVPVVLLAAGGVGLGVASALWVSGLGDRSNMESSCAPTHSCPQTQIDSARGKLVAGDIVGGVGVVAAATGLGLLIFGGSGGGGGDSRPVAVDVHPLTGGAQLSVQARF